MTSCAASAGETVSAGTAGTTCCSAAAAAISFRARRGPTCSNGGPGNDRAFGGAGADDLQGGPGIDILGGGLGPDELSGGAGRDIVLYGQRGQPVRVSIGAGANDGLAGEGDDVHADVEAVQGGRGNDVLIGSRGANTLIGGGGRDRMRGMGGNDFLSGGDDRLNDRIDARDGAGFVDRVMCGDGQDTALVDPGDIVDPDCENVVGGAPATPPPVGNRAPTGIALSNASVAENQPVGTTVGTLSAGDPDPGDTHSFALVPGQGSDDNGSFQIVGSALRTNAVFNYEAKSTYTVRVRATDFGTPAGQIVRSFTITVTDVNDPPAAVDDSATVGEDSAAGAIDVLANDTDTDGGPKTIASASDPANGAVVLTGGSAGAHTGLTYQPDANYCGPDTFTYTLNGGSTATVSVTVTCVDDAPTAIDDSATVVEDSPASAIDVLANDTDTDGGPKSVASVMQPANGTVVITGGGSGLTYQPNANYCSATPDSFTYTLNGGDSATVSVTVTCVDDPPTAVNDSRRWPRTRPRPRSTCWRTTPTSTAGPSRSRR